MVSTVCFLMPCTHTTVLSRFRCSGTLYHGDIAVCTPQTNVARLLACFLYQGTIRFSITEIPCHASTILFSANVIAERAILCSVNTSILYSAVVISQLVLVFIHYANKTTFMIRRTFLPQKTWMLPSSDPRHENSAKLLPSA